MSHRYFVRGFMSNPCNSLYEYQVRGSLPFTLRRSPFVERLVFPGDRPEASLRRRSYTRNYTCPSGQDRDEYPQAVFEENLGSAHIKCISSSDNRGSGSSVGLQINTYKFTDNPAEQPQPRLDNGDTIEFVVLD